jgi:hypothetical protein
MTRLDSKGQKEEIGLEDIYKNNFNPRLHSSSYKEAEAVESKNSQTPEVSRSKPWQNCRAAPIG